MDEKHVVLAGSGIMGASLAQVYAQAGYNVSLWNRSEKGLDRAKELIALNQETMLKEQMLTKEDSEGLLGRISFTTSKDCMKDCCLLVEAIAEDLDVKKEFFTEVSRIVPEEALVATNSSALPITKIAEAVYLPGRFMGQHWLNPPHLLPLCEIIRGEKTEEPYVEKMYALVKGLGKSPVIVQKDAPGYILNRLQYAVLREALYIVESGIASIEDVDTVFKAGLGLRYAALGPFRVCDLGGLHTFNKVNKFLNPYLSARQDGDPMLDEIVSKGNYGVITGAGFYDYSGDKAAEAIRERDKLYIDLAKVLYYRHD